MLLVCFTNIMAYAVNIQTARCRRRSCGFVDISIQGQRSGKRYGVRGFEIVLEAKTINKRHGSYLGLVVEISGMVLNYMGCSLGSGLRVLRPKDCLLAFDELWRL